MMDSKAEKIRHFVFIFVITGCGNRTEYERRIECNLQTANDLPESMQKPVQGLSRRRSMP
jgi:hypothetical protein